MKTVTMLQLRRRAGNILRQVARGESFVITHRGKPVAQLSPLVETLPSADDPIYRLAELADDRAEPLDNDTIDDIVYR